MVAKVPKVPKKGELELDNIYLGDSIEGMKLIPDASIDLVITSPPYSDMKSYEGGFNGFHPDNYIEWFLPYVSEISRILKPTGSFILNINDKADKGFRHPFVFELIYAIHNSEEYCKSKGFKPLDMHGLKLFERLFWNKGKFLAHSKRFGDKVEFLFWFSKSKDKKFNVDPMRLEYDEKSIKRMMRPLIKRYARDANEGEVHYKQGGEGTWAPNEKGALPSVLIEEGAMLHVHPIVEDLPEGTDILVERLDGDTYQLVTPEAGKTAHPSTVVNIGSESRRIADNHVAVYPERLVSYFIQGSTDKGDIVLDPFMGTGTTAVVANALGRKYLGFDISEEYVKFGNQRVSAGPYMEDLKKANAGITLLDFAPPQPTPEEAPDKEAAPSYSEEPKKKERTKLQSIGDLGEEFARKQMNATGGCRICKGPRNKIKELPPSFHAVDLICELCGRSYQVKTTKKDDTSTPPSSVRGAQFAPLDRRKKEGIFHSLVVVVLKKGDGGPIEGVTRQWRKNSTVWYLNSSIVKEHFDEIFKPYDTEIQKGKEKGRKLTMTTLYFNEDIKKKFVRIWPPLEGQTSN